MRADAIFLANSAEVKDGLLYLMGGGWTTINVAAPLAEPAEDAPPPPVAVLAGSLVVRLMVAPGEAGRAHRFDARIEDADGGEVATLGGELQAGRSPETPTSWDEEMNLVFPLSGVALPGFGLYRIEFSVEGERLGEVRFQAIKRY